MVTLRPTSEYIQELLWLRCFSIFECYFDIFRHNEDDCVGQGAPLHFGEKVFLGDNTLIIHLFCWNRDHMEHTLVCVDHNKICSNEVQIWGLSSEYRWNKEWFQLLSSLKFTVFQEAGLNETLWLSARRCCWREILNDSNTGSSHRIFMNLGFMLRVCIVWCQLILKKTQLECGKIIKMCLG